MMFIHSIFVVAFFLFFTLRTVELYMYSGFASKLTTSAVVVRMTQFFDLEKCFIWKTLLQVFERENDLMQ